jgi:hypothetical protein
MDSVSFVNLNRSAKSPRGKSVTGKVSKNIQKEINVQQPGSCSDESCAVNWKPIASVEQSRKRSEH